MIEQPKEASALLEEIKSNIVPPRRRPVTQITDDEYIDMLKACERYAKEDAASWKFRFKAVLFVVVVAAPIFWRVAVIISSPTYIEPEEDSVTKLRFYHRSFFGNNNYETMEARPTDFGTVQWMRRSQNGEWDRAFTWDEP